MACWRGLRHRQLNLKPCRICARCRRAAIPRLAELASRRFAANRGLFPARGARPVRSRGQPACRESAQILNMRTDPADKVADELLAECAG